DHRLLNWLAEFTARPLNQFAQDQGGNLLRRKSLIAKGHGFLHSHPALDAAHGALWIEDLLVARRLSYQKFPGWREPHAGGEHFCSAPEDPHTIANIRRDLRVCGSQIDAYDERSEERRVGKECRSRWWPYE